MLTIKSTQSPIIYNHKKYITKKGKLERIKGEQYAQVTGTDGITPAAPATPADSTSTGGWLGSLNNVIKDVTPLAASATALGTSVSNAIVQGKKDSAAAPAGTNTQKPEAGKAAEAPKKGMSTGTKIILGILAFGVVGGGIWYFVKHKK